MGNASPAGVWCRIHPDVPAPTYVRCGKCGGLYPLGDCRVRARAVAVGRWPQAGGLSEKASEKLRADRKDLDEHESWRLCCPNEHCTGEARRDGGNLEPLEVKET
jgi:hypothetical protein